MNKEQIKTQIKNGLIVSCQMEKHAPCYSDNIVSLMVNAAIWGGAKGLRIEGEQNIKDTRKITNLPIIGLIKIFRVDTPVFMTPSLDEVKKVIGAGADIVAIDGTDRLIDGRIAYSIIDEIKDNYPDVPILADIRDLDDAKRCLEKGVDYLAPTFYRFSEHAKSTNSIDWPFVAKLCKLAQNKAKVIMEGKVWTSDDVLKSFYYGCHSVCVGSAITRPHLITQHFTDAINGYIEERSLFY